MSTEDWVLGYARQAAADFEAWERYEKHPVALVADCHKLLFLQMACEKLCKAHLVKSGRAPEKVQRSHRFKGHLCVVIRQEVSFASDEPRKLRNTMVYVKHLANEIELLNPAMQRVGHRPDNCEYAWEDGGRVFSPLDHTFIPLRLVDQPAGRTFLKLVSGAIRRLVHP